MDIKLTGKDRIAAEAYADAIAENKAGRDRHYSRKRYIDGALAEIAYGIEQGPETEARIRAHLDPTHVCRKIYNNPDYSRDDKDVDVKSCSWESMQQGHGNMCVSEPLDDVDYVFMRPKNAEHTEYESVGWIPGSEIKKPGVGDKMRGVDGRPDFWRVKVDKLRPMSTFKSR